MRNYYIILCATLFFSCRSNIQESYHSFNHNEWNSDSIVTLKYNIYDTTKRYNLSLKIRHTVNYEFQNLFLFLKEEKCDTIEIMLANKNGEWLGNGIGDVREAEYVLYKKRRVKKRGEHIISVEQAMRYGALKRIENLEHILDIGLIVYADND